MPFLTLDVETRRVICSTSAIENVDARTSRAVKAADIFPGEQAALQCVYVTIMSLDLTGAGRKRGPMHWKPTLNAFEVVSGGRLAAGDK